MCRGRPCRACDLRRRQPPSIPARGVSSTNVLGADAPGTSSRDRTLTCCAAPPIRRPRMAGQGLERREVLRMLALAAAASGHPGFHRWSFACGHGGDRLQVKPTRYVPRFFSAEEYAVVERLADLVIPSDGTPGASEAGVAEFVDFMVDHDPGVQYRFRYGLVWLDARARKAQGRSFRELPRADQEEILGGLAYRARHRPGEEEGRAFFKLVREYTL